MADFEIEISELRLVINRILDHIEHCLGKSKITLDHNDYWDVAYEERYDFGKSPQKFDHGQLADDWEFLSTIIKDKDQAVTLMLLHAAPLLRRIGEQNHQEPAPDF